MAAIMKQLTTNCIESVSDKFQDLDNEIIKLKTNNTNLENTFNNKLKNIKESNDRKFLKIVKNMVIFKRTYTNDKNELVNRIEAIEKKCKSLYIMNMFYFIAIIILIILICYV